MSLHFRCIWKELWSQPWYDFNDMAVGVPNDMAVGVPIYPVRSYWVLCFLSFYFVSSWKNQDQMLSKAIKSISVIFCHFGPWKYIFHNPALTFAVRIDWYYSNWLDELIRLHPLDRQKMHGVESNRASKMKSLENQRWTAHSWTPMSFLYVYI